MREDDDDETIPPVDDDVVPVDADAAEKKAYTRHLPPGRTGRTGG